MHLPPPQPPAESVSATYVAAREDVLWGRPIFRAPALTVFTAPELLRPEAPVFPVRTFRSLHRKNATAA
jgi:hypothetical protein